MTDILVRNLPDEVVRAIDSRAAAAGISRNEYLRRRLLDEAQHRPITVDVADLQAFSAVFVDLGNDEVMKEAWR